MTLQIPKPPKILINPKDLKTGAVEVPETFSFIPLGITNEKKLIIGTSFSENGTSQNRLNFDYGTFWGGAGGDVADTLRDIGGKYWTFTDDKSNIVFLSNDIGKVKGKDIPGADPARAQIPYSVYYEQPKLLNNKVWGEYEQTMYITPDSNWLYGTFAQGVFNVSKDEIKQTFGAMSNEDILSMTNATIKEHGVQGSNLNLQESVDIYIEKVIETQSEQILMLIQDWWKRKLSILPPPVGSEVSKGPCAALLDFAELSANDPSISNTFGPQEICSPWLNPNQQYIDHVVDSYTPIVEDQSELSQMNLGIKTPFFSVSSEYNFYIKSYEDAIMDHNVPENLLPNMYVFIASFASKNVTDEHPDFLRYERIITLDGIVSEFSYDALKINENNILENNNLKEAPAASGQYFNYWSSNLTNEIKQFPNKLNILNQSVGKKQNLVFYPMQDTDILQNYNDQKFMFPMYNELEFSTGVTNVVGDTLRQTALSNHFMRYYSINNSKRFSDQSLFDNNSNVMREKIPFTIVEKKTSFSNFEGDKKTTSELQIDTNTLVDTTSMIAFLASVDFGNLIGDGKAGSVSNFGLTQEQIDYVKSTFNSSDLKNMFSENSIFVAKDENEEFLLSSPSNEMQRVMLSAILYGKIKKLEKQHHRSFAAMMSGDSNYTETIMYEVGKRQVGEDGTVGDLIQEYYFLNSSETDVIKFIDTQVSYGIQYQYDITAIVLSFGMNYEYKTPEIISEMNFDGTDYSDIAKYSESLPGTGTGPLRQPTEPKPQIDVNKKSVFAEGSTILASDVDPTDRTGAELNFDSETLTLTENLFDSKKAYNNIFTSAHVDPTISEIGGNFMTAKVKIRYRPDYRLLRLSYGSSRGVVIDKPPVFPDALITPYKGLNNKLLINLNQNVGEYSMKPIIIDPEEKEQYLKIAESQKVKITPFDSEPPIAYKSDDPLGDGGYFEVYRIDKKPSSYFDFADNLLTTIDGFHEAEVGHVSTDSASLRDDIKPNKKYYYMFRVVDVHGHVSNPSPIFEVEMVDDGGTVYMIQNIVELDEPDIKEVGKSFKKYLQVKPVFQQTLLSVPNSDSPLPSAYDYGEIGTEGDINLGTAQTALWGKKFKIRITSKSSGKQIDLNITFTKKQQNNLAENAEGGLFSKHRP